MALRRSISKRFLDGFTLPSPSTSLVLPHSDAVQLISRREFLSPSGSAGNGFLRRFLQRRAIYHSPAPARVPEVMSLPIGEKLREKLGGNNIAGDRIRLEGLAPPAAGREDESATYGISISDARKIMRFALVEKLKEKLRNIPMSSISYSEFNRICVEGCGNEDQGAEFAKLLDESGNVIILGNVVYLRPDQVAKSMERVFTRTIATPSDPRFKQLAEMGKEKAIIDRKAEAQVQTELYCGLGFLVAQTLGFMRLTFWDLSWDVMEPICFFVTSAHVALGYGFFLSTSTEPTFEGVFRRRFKTKQKKLMAAQNFDVNLYNQLQKACYSGHTNWVSEEGVQNSHIFQFDC